LKGWLRKLRRPSTARGYRCFFATDIHGSDRCFRKFLAAAHVYEADALILGGDIAGKAIVPVCRADGGDLEFSYLGERRRVAAREAEEGLRPLRAAGLYPKLCSPEDLQRLRVDAPLREQLFEELIVQQVRSWCQLASARLDQRIRCVITPGNDDPLAIDDALTEDSRVECPEGELLELGPIILASLGDVNRTPWDTPREFDEPELARRIDEVLSPVSGDQKLVLNFHCPPYDSGLDTAAKLDDDLRPVVQHGQVVQVPVGSTAVRKAIERYGPVVGLHGHIHESPGACRLGRTTCLNPGSDYGSGVLKGAVVQFDVEGNYLGHLLTTG
jgi:Icc-related predicted phosphoesterase